MPVEQCQVPGATPGTEADVADTHLSKAKTVKHPSEILRMAYRQTFHTQLKLLVYRTIRETNLDVWGLALGLGLQI